MHSFILFIRLTGKNWLLKYWSYKYISTKNVSFFTNLKVEADMEKLDEKVFDAVNT